MIDKANSSTVQYLASGLKYLIKEIDIEKVEKIPSDKTYKQSSGIGLLFIVNLASIVEGILREYLIEVIYNGFQVLKSEYFLENHKNLSSEKSLTDRGFKSIVNTLYGELEGINKKPFESLKKMFIDKMGEKFDDKLILNNESISKDIHYLFSLRNLTIHANGISLNWGDKYTGEEGLIYNDYEFTDKYKNVHDFLVEKKLINNKKEKFFRDNFINKKVLDYFYGLVFQKYLELEIWNNCSRVSGIKNQIMK